MLTNCKELNFEVGTELAHKCKSYRLKVGLFHGPNQINEMNDSRGGRCFKSPLKQKRGHLETSNLAIMYIIT